jgi:AcrR family transcriptional regulator
MGMDFKRARTDEQRAERRRVILDAAAAMLTEMPVARLSLNELSRRVGLAKSNVLRYFESREAVLLELLDAELEDWVSELARSSEAVEGTPRERGDRFATILAESMARRPVMCDLVSAQAAVLEHNVSAEVVVRHKRATTSIVEALAGLAQRHLPELGGQDAVRLVAIVTLMATAVWPASQPPEAVLAAYAADPAIGALRMDFADLMRQATEVAISGLLARGEDSALGVTCMPGAPLDLE